MPITLTDASGFAGTADRVLTPASEAELLAILAEARQTRTPITVVGSRKGLVGGAMPSGGWALSTAGFTRLETRPGRAIAGAGILLGDLQKAALATGQFYPPDPTERTATVGGTVSTNASGARSFLYGATRASVRALRVVLMDGTVLAPRRGEPIPFGVPHLPSPRTTKHQAGYPLRPGMDWVDLLVGSEGTLGIVTEAELTLLPIPDAVVTGVLFFPDDDAALAAVDALRPLPGLRMIEYFDRGALALLRSAHPDVPPSAAAALMVESSEGEAWRAWHGAQRDSWVAVTAEERERVRLFRHGLPEQVNELMRRRGLLKVGSDYAVPLDRSRDMLAVYQEALAREFPGRHCIFGHIGDAHVHVNILPDPPDFDRAWDLVWGFARRAVEMGGSVSAEHGLGKRKAHLLALQYTPDQVEAMRTVKRRLDPLGLLGPGTLFPVQSR